MATSETVLLKSTLEIENKPYSVKLTSTELYWEAVSSTRAATGPYSEPLVTTENQTVKLSEVIAVRLGNKDHYANKATTSGDSKRGFNNLEMESLSPTTFCVWMVKRLPKHKWRERQVVFSSKDTSVVQQWVEKIQEILNKPELQRPRSLLVFINPVGGKKIAVKTYREKVAPLFDLAGISTEVINTQRQYHARDTLLDYDLSKIDGVVCVGGDGMFTEIVHGLLKRTLRDQNLPDKPTPDSPLPKPALRVGIIPAGSTDTVIFTMCGWNDPARAALHIIIGSTNTTIYSLQGSQDATAAALHVVIGDSIAMDVATVHHGEEFIKYNVSLNGYGYLGDSLLDSENNRWLGPKRYDWAGLKMLMKNQVYEGELSYLPSSDAENHPRDRTFCKAGCQVCQSSPSTSEEDTATEWKKIKGKFIAINSYVISCRCRFSMEGPAPACHIGDGNADLVMVHECGRLDNAKQLLRCTKPNKDQFDFPFVSVERVCAYKFRPAVEELEDTHDAASEDGKGGEGSQRLRSQGQLTSTWNCDGEPVEESAIDFRVHRQVLKIFARGVEDEIKPETTECVPCSM